eukprot:TRINITY_DN6698_c0_g1_i1.p1 TRINITY_DN6698_c0_g1~~TRINITY_DN6698_c0_g1_i1.p1  ORF type:complete len:240 (-),score=57.22 TRINITY_DN6698_c0_g1_i1:33-752(-)
MEPGVEQIYQDAKDIVSKPKSFFLDFKLQGVEDRNADKTPDQLQHLTAADMDKYYDLIMEAPTNDGKIVGLVVRRVTETDPKIHALEEKFTVTGGSGITGDKWTTTTLPKKGLQVAQKQQVSIMNARIALLVAGSPERMALAGDNVLVDMSLENLYPGTKIKIGQVTLLVSDYPHTGCAIFQRRFGPHVRGWINAPERKSQHFRGVYCDVIEGGDICFEDKVEVLYKAPPPKEPEGKAQ